jgi:hypothetical protein
MKRFLQSFLCLMLVVGFSLRAKAETPLALKYIHPDALASGMVNVKSLLTNPSIKKLLQQLQEISEMQKGAGFLCTDIDELRFNVKLKSGEKATPGPDIIMITRLNRPEALGPMMDKAAGDGAVEMTRDNLTFKFRQVKIGGGRLDIQEKYREGMEALQKAYEGEGSLVYKINDRTTLFSTSIRAFLETPDIKQPATSKPAWSDKFSADANKSAVIVVDLKQVRDIVAREKQRRQPRMQGMEEILFNSASVIWEKGDCALVSLDSSNGITLTAKVFSSTEDGAKDVAGMFEGIRAIARGMLPSMKPTIERIEDGEVKKSAEASYASAEKLLFQAKVAHSGTEASLTLSISQDELTQLGATALVNAIRAQKSAAQRMSSINNLKQIALAIITYADANKQFPKDSPAKLGRPAVSWRVKILPFVEQMSLYNLYKMDEPWDSENNKKVLAAMPAVYRHPKQDPASTNSSYFALAGKEGLLATGDNGIKIKQVTDGLSHTLLVVEAEREIPWTKPEDIEVEKGKVPELGLKDSPIFAAAFADGSVRSISKKIDADLFWKLFTRAGGEIVGEDEIDPNRPKPNGAKINPGSKLPPPQDPFDDPPTNANIPPVP